MVIVVLGFAAYEHGTDVSLAAPKAWEVRTLANGTAQASLRTVWRDGRVSYQLRVEPYPAEVAAATKSSTSVKQHFIMEFLDADGFRLLSHSIEPKELGLVARPDGTVLAIEARGDGGMTRELYQRAQKWDIRWSFD